MEKKLAAGGSAERKSRESLYVTIVLDLFVIALFVGQILVYDDYYFNILEIKYYYFCVCTLSMLWLLGGYGVMRLVWPQRPQAAVLAPIVSACILVSVAIGRLEGQWLAKVLEFLRKGLLAAAVIYVLVQLFLLGRAHQTEQRPGKGSLKNSAKAKKEPQGRGAMAASQAGSLQDRISAGLAELRGKKFWELFNSTDIMMMAFAVIVALSSLLSPFQYESFWGNEGRYVGAFMLLLCVAIYFCVSRLYRVKWWHIEIFLIVGMIMCLLGISDYFRMDLLQFKVNIKDNQRDMFTSFIGNINSYTAGVALVLGVAGVLFAESTSIIGNLWYGVCVIISFIAIITGQSDNAYLTLIAFFGFLPLYLFRSRRGFCKYVLLLALFLGSLRWVLWTQTKYEGVVIRLGGLFRTLMDLPQIAVITKYVWLLAAFLCALELLIYFWKLWRKMRTKGNSATAAEKKRSRPWAVWAWWVVVIGAAAMLAYVVYDATFAGNADRYGVFKQYVQFGDSWGTHRGYIWRIAIEDYMKFPPLQKILGYGPDTFGLVSYYDNLLETIELYNERFDSVHNEFLQYLVTIGPIGLLSYLGILITSVWNVVRRRLDNPYIMGAMFAVICYNVQAVVNIHQPIVMPVMWLLLCISMAKPAARLRWSYVSMQKTRQ